VYEKIRNGIWVYNDLLELVDGWQETNERRQVFKFRLQLLDEADAGLPPPCPVSRRKTIASFLPL
jgi:hypothetical protein